MKITNGINQKMLFVKTGYCKKGTKYIMYLVFIKN